MKWERPNFYRKPGLAYQKLGQHRHRDIFDREWTGDYDDRYISSWDGKVSKLVVQAVDDIYENNTGSTHRRTFVRNVAPIYMRLANWPFNHIDFARNHGNIPNEDLPMLCLKWFVASCFITIFVSPFHPHFDHPADGAFRSPVQALLRSRPATVEATMACHTSTSDIPRSPRTRSRCTGLKAMLRVKLTLLPNVCCVLDISAF